jgi:cell wall-associated NlpC family hydrolase
MSAENEATGGWDRVAEGQIVLLPPGGMIVPAALARGIREQGARARVVAEALTWVRTPYAHMGRVKGAGVDCGQLLALVYEAAGVTPEVVPESYPHDWHMHRSEERYLGHVEHYAHQIPGPPLPGDIALYRYGRTISHGAIVTRWPQVIHAYVGKGVILDDALGNADLKKHFVGFWSPWGAE